MSSPRGVFKAFFYRELSHKNGRYKTAYTRCCDELLAQVEVLRLATEASTTMTIPILMCYHVDPSFTVEEFMKAYDTPNLRMQLQTMREAIAKAGWKFPQLSKVAVNSLLAKVRDLPADVAEDGDDDVSTSAAMPLELVTGPQHRKSSKAELAAREAVLRATVEKYLPDFVQAVQNAPANIDVITLHQDAFAAGYHTDEYTLLGLAIKYAGLYGRAVTVVGLNAETLKR